MNKLAALLFPPNWSACVSGPHLAMPLLAGVARANGWDALCWDLSETFYRTMSNPPSGESIRIACASNDFEKLDKLYFNWEDQFRRFLADKGACAFGLLSGFGFQQFSSLPLKKVVDAIQLYGTVFDSLYEQVVLPKLIALEPAIIGITIASRHQVVPTLHLLQRVRAALPDTIVILGGNILTRLRESVSFEVFQSHADQIVLYQGDLAFGRTIKAVNELGVRARSTIPPVDGDEQISYLDWVVPRFDGIDLHNVLGPTVLPYVSTRGCYWGRCNFCAIPAGWARSGYGGTAPPDFVSEQLTTMARQTGVRRVKFVDEAISPSKIRRLSTLLSGCEESIEWEAYARLERDWENVALLQAAYESGLRKLYLGLEQAPTTNRKILNKNDKGDIFRIMAACDQSQVKLHLFCMVGHPGTTVDDAWATTQFLIQHEHLIDTADLVGFRLDRGASVPGVRAKESSTCDWETSTEYEPTELGILNYERVSELESECQEHIWNSVPRLMHPFYRLIGPWTSSDVSYSDPSKKVPEVELTH